MQRRRETDLDELLEHAEPTAEQAPPAKADTPVARTLELQRTAGNRAVGAALARWPMLWYPRAKEQWPKEPQVIVDGKTIPIVSFSWGESSGTSSGIGAGGGPGKAHFQDIHISVRPGTHSSELAVATAQGQHFKTLIIVVPKGDSGHTITLQDVLFSSYSTAGDVDTFTASFANYEMGTSPPPTR